MRIRTFVIVSFCILDFAGPSAFAQTSSVAQRAVDTLAGDNPTPAASSWGRGDPSDYCQLGCYRVRAFGEYLAWRARDAEVPFAVQTNSNLPAPGGVPVQTSPIALVDPDFSSGFRLGGGVCLDECSELALAYTCYDVGTHQAITSGIALQQVTSLVAHPSTVAANIGTVSADADLSLNLQRIDLDYRRYFFRTDCTDINWLAGFAYGQLTQEFHSRLTDDLQSSVNDATWATDVDFYGAGLRLGLEAEHYARRAWMVFYGKGVISLLAGEFDATYQQTVQNNSHAGVNTGWTAGRIVPTFDLEVGGGFHLPGGRMRATVGYVFDAWTNVVKTRDWIQAVQTNNYNDLSGTLTFDGLVARIEGRF